MTERKSTEIKFRVTPSFKARVISAAGASEAESLTEWLEQAAEERILADQNRSLDGTVLLNYAIDAHKNVPKPPWTPESHPAKSWMYEGQAPPERRTEPCPHSKPPYAFCAECDS